MTVRRGGPILVPMPQAIFGSLNIAPEELSRDLLAAVGVQSFLRSKGTLTIVQAKEKLAPKMGFEAFARILMVGHRHGVLVLSRMDLPQVNGTSYETGEIRYLGATFHKVSAA